MTLRPWCLIAVLGVLGGCGQGISGEPVEPSVDPTSSDLAGFDPCAALSDAEVQVLGFRPESREQTETLGLVGCSYYGPPNSVLGSLSVNKDPETVGDYARRGDTFGGFRKNTVAGRLAAQVQVTDNNTDCTQMVNAGSGTVQVDWSIRESGAMDPCVEALRVMQMIEPELPAVGS